MFKGVASILLSTTILVGSAGCSSSKPDASGPRSAIKRLRLAFEKCEAGALMQAMAPHQRAQVSDALAADFRSECEKDPNTQNVILALKAAEGMLPEIDKNGAIAVYDLDGMGFNLPDTKFRVIKIDGEWYVLE